MITNESNFEKIHRHLLNKPSVEESKTASRIAKTINQENNDSIENGFIQTTY